jgi:hypothetical protein
MMFRDGKWVLVTCALVIAGLFVIALMLAGILSGEL